MSEFNLSGSYIQDTFPRIIQIGSGSLRDGTGSALPISIDGDDVRIAGALIANRLIVTESVSQLYANGSSRFGDDATDTHQFTGSLLVSHSIIKADGTGSSEWDTAYGWGDHSDNDYISHINNTASISAITASSYISASTIYTSDLKVTGSAQMSGNLIFAGITFSDTIIETHSGSHTWGDSLTDDHIFSGSILVTNSISINGVDVESNLVPSTSSATNDQILTYSSSAITWKDAPISIDTSSIGTLLPDGTNDLGSDSAKWENLYAKNTYFGGIHEINLESEGISLYPLGTILVQTIDGLKPCEDLADPMVMGVSNAVADYPIVMGAEPVLIDGPISMGDFIVTSTKRGHGKAITPDELSQVNLHGRIIAQALENSPGGLIKAMIRKM